MFDRKAWMKVYKQVYYKRHRRSLIAYSAGWNKRHPEARALLNARARCVNPKDHAYNGYGARGIRFDLTLDSLLLDIGLRPSNHFSLDRIDNDGNYEVGNIRWATRSQQQRNRRKPRSYKRTLCRG